MRLVLIGGPGSGKGTLGSLLATRLQVPHISTGSMIRSLIAEGSTAGMRYADLIAGGNFIPDADMVEIVGERLHCPDTSGGYILDGFPRDRTQAVLFDSTEVGRLLDHAIELQIDEATLIARLGGRLVCPQCGSSYHVTLQPPRFAGICDLDGAQLMRRPDDEPDAIHTRLLVYERQTQPLVGHYAGQGKLLSVDASGSPDEVFRRTIRLLLPDAA